MPDAHHHHSMYVLVLAAATLAVIIFFWSVNTTVGSRSYCTSAQGIVSCFTCSANRDGLCSSALCFGHDPDCGSDGAPTGSCTALKCERGRLAGSCVSSTPVLVDGEVIDCCTGTYCTDGEGYARCEDPDKDEHTCVAYSDPPYSFAWEGHGGISNCCRDDANEGQCDSP